MTHQTQFRTIAISILVLLVVALACTSRAWARPPGSDGNASFPEVSDSWSPDGRFVVKNVDDPQDPKSPHSIYLVDMETGRRTVLYSYPRKVDLYWSPASDALAINDWDANDDAQCIVFILAPRPARIDVREEFLKSRRPDQEKKLATDRHNYDHNYAHLIRWLNPTTLLSVFEGHSSDRKRSFQLVYEYKLGESFRLRRRFIS